MGLRGGVVVSDDDPDIVDRVSAISLSTGLDVPGLAKHVRPLVVEAAEDLVTSISFLQAAKVPPAPLPFEEDGPSLVREERPAWQPRSEGDSDLMAGLPIVPVTPTVTSVSDSMTALMAGELDYDQRRVVDPNPVPLATEHVISLLSTEDEVVTVVQEFEVKRVDLSWVTMVTPEPEEHDHLVELVVTPPHKVDPLLDKCERRTKTHNYYPC